MRNMLKYLLFVLVLAAGPMAQADALLPVAKGRYTASFVQNSTQAPLPQGAWVEFVGSTDKGVPRKLRIQGYVLGRRNNVVFIEVTETAAAQLAHARPRGEVRLQLIEDPDPDVIAERRRAAELGQSVTIAPRMRTITLPVQAKSADKWAPGERLVFPDMRHPGFFGGAYHRDVTALFRSVEETGPERFAVTLIVDPGTALFLLRAAEKGELPEPRGETEPDVQIENARRCYITHRRELSVQRIEIPCD